MRWLILGSLLVACGDDDVVNPVAVSIDAGVIEASAPEAGAPNPDAPPVVAVKQYWHIERPVDSKRTWMVDPSQHRQFVLAVDSVFRDDACNGIGIYVHRSLDADRVEATRMTGEFGFNAYGAFGAPTDPTSPPYAIVLEPVPLGHDRALKNASGALLVGGNSQVLVGDPWNPEFDADILSMIANQVSPHESDARLMLYYMGTESGMFDRSDATGGLRDLRKWLWSDCPASSTVSKPLCAPHALVQFLESIYPTIAALNSTWNATYASFDAVRNVTTCNAACSNDLLRFVQERLVPTWVTLVTSRVHDADHNHLVASPRLATSDFHFWSTGDTFADDGSPIGNADLLPALAKFDLVAVNLYSSDPTFDARIVDGLHKLQADTQQPLIVSELGTRTKVTGWSNASGAPAFVADQATRTARYASQLAQLVSFPDIVGIAWHAWSDRYVADDPNSQIEEGLVQCDDLAHGMTAGTAWPGLDLLTPNGAILRTITATTGL
jgi:hypothetical protein